MPAGAVGPEAGRTGAGLFGRQRDGTTVATHYAGQGIALRVANTARNWWAEVQHPLGDVEAGIAPRTSWVRRTLEQPHPRVPRALERFSA